MEIRSVLCIAHGLNLTETLEEINVEGNPIGKFGMKLLLNSITANKN